MRRVVVLVALTLLAGHASAQTNVNTFILEVAVNNTTPTEGQLQTYGLQIETAQGQPAPQGTVYWLNGTTILAQANLNTGTLINGNVTVVNATDASPLPIGTYNQINAYYPGSSNTTYTWLSNNSTSQGVPYLSFTVSPASAAVTTSITALSLNNTALIYGQTESFGTQVQVPLGSPVPQGGIVSFLNGTQVLATAFLNGTGAVVSGNNVTINATNTQLLAVGTYNSYQTLYPGFTNSTNFTWTGATSNTLLNPFTFTVSAANVGLFFSSTAFTLQNFTSSFFLNVTNVNGTGVPPAGPTFEVITNADTGQVIGNYTLVYTQLDANTLAASLPASFNASQLLGVGNYTAVFTYSGTSNFFDPSPLTVQFSIANVGTPPPPPPPPTPITPGSPSPPPPPGALPPPPPPGVLPPPPPPSGVLPTVTQVEAYFEAQKNFLKTCKSSNLIFTAAVTGPNSTLVPMTGYIYFTLIPSGTPIGQGGIIADRQLGLASVTIVKKPGNSGVYGIPPPGAYTVMASYSGDINGTFAPSNGTTQLIISNNCADILTEMGSKFGNAGLMGSIGNNVGSEADDSQPKYSLSNNYAGTGSLNGYTTQPGSFYNGNNQPYTTPGAYTTP